MMTLADYEVFPAVVVDAEDPKLEGRIRVAAPGKFDPDIMGIDNLLWVNPILPTFQAYSQLVKGDKVIVFHNINNYFEYWYIKNFEMNGNTKALIDNTQTDVVISRTKTNGNDAQIYYKDKVGININIGTGKVHINKDGNVRINGTTTANISAPAVFIGSDDYFNNEQENDSSITGQSGAGLTWEAAALGDSTASELDRLWTAIDGIVLGFMSNPYTATQGTLLQQSIKALKAGSNIELVKSHSVKISR